LRYCRRLRDATPISQVAVLQLERKSESVAMRILVAPDKFKGSLGAEDVGAAIARGLQSALPTRSWISSLSPMGEKGRPPPSAALVRGIGFRSQPMMRLVVRAKANMPGWLQRVSLPWK
jgi:hypothetical protein